MELALKIKLRISVIEGGKKTGKFTRYGVICYVSIKSQRSNVEIIQSEIREILVDKQFTKEEHNTESGNALYLE